MEDKEKRTRNSEATRCAALDAARHLFAEKGFAGTSMREIASASGVSQPLIHYHFGSKEGLYKAVKERLIAEGLRSIQPVTEGPTDTAADPSELIRTTYNFISGNEALRRLTAWAHLERETTPWPGEEEIMRIVAGHIQRHLSDFPSGRDVDPLIVTIMIEGLILFWSENCHYFAGLFDEPLATVTDRYLDQVARLFFPKNQCPQRPGVREDVI